MGKIGNYAYITKGKYKGKYGKIIDSSCTSNRIVYDIALDDGIIAEHIGHSEFLSSRYKGCLEHKNHKKNKGDSN